jgi:predicted metal-binding membrane protein
MSTVWMPMGGQSWLDGAAAFLGMWTVMMAAMMLPSLVPALWRYRQSVIRAGGLPSALMTALAGGGYILIWALLGVAIYPLGAATIAATMRYPALTRATPMAIGLLVLSAGALQLTQWKAHHLARCRGHCCELRGCRRRAGANPLPVGAFAAWRHGVRLGLHCTQCCAGLTAVLLATGIMDMPAMLAVTAAITLERLAPAGERIARAIGVVAIGAGLFLTFRATVLG